MTSCVCCFEPCTRPVVCMSTRVMHKGYYLCWPCEAAWAGRTDRCMVCNEEPATTIQPCAFMAACCATAAWGAFTLYLATLFI